jgi:hypothetical protein
MSFAAAILASTAISSVQVPPTTVQAPAMCSKCTLDAPPHGDAIPLIVVLRDEHDTSPRDSGEWREPARTNGWALLTLVGWEHGEPSWIAAQVLATAKLLPIDLARMYLISSSNGAAYMARHVQALSETFAALVITGGGGLPEANACPDQVLPVYFLVDARDIAARAFRSYLERCKQPMVWNLTQGPPDRRTVLGILDWLRHHVRVTTVAIDLSRSRVMLAKCGSPLESPSYACWC